MADPNLHLNLHPDDAATLLQLAAAAIADGVATQEERALVDDAGTEGAAALAAQQTVATALRSLTAAIDDPIVAEAMIAKALQAGPTRPSAAPSQTVARARLLQRVLPLALAASLLVVGAIVVLRPRAGSHELAAKTGQQTDNPAALENNAASKSLAGDATRPQAGASGGAAAPAAGIGGAPAPVIAGAPAQSDVARSAIDGGQIGAIGSATTVAPRVAAAVDGDRSSGQAASGRTDSEARCTSQAPRLVSVHLTNVLYRATATSGGTEVFVLGWATSGTPTRVVLVLNAASCQLVDQAPF